MRVYHDVHVHIIYYVSIGMHWKSLKFSKWAWVPWIYFVNKKNYLPVAHHLLSPRENYGLTGQNICKIVNLLHTAELWAKWNKFNIRCCYLMLNFPWNKVAHRKFHFCFSNLSHLVQKYLGYNWKKTSFNPLLIFDILYLYYITGLSWLVS